MDQEYRQGNFIISTDPKKLDMDQVHSFLVTTYWAREIPKEIVANSFKNSLAFGVYTGDQQVGVARVITDYTTFAYLADVFIQPEYRGQGLAKWLIHCIMSHPKLQGLRRWLLATSDAHGLYGNFGFVQTESPENFMEIWRPDIYKNV